jgi:tetratricopeptide (TPR) repeat protein
MKKIVILLILFLYPIVNFAQSRAGYINAGDECMVKNDGFSAIGFYEQAAAYSEDADLFLKTAKAYFSVNDYSKALLNSEKARKEATTTEIKKSSILLTGELLKRTGRYKDAISLLKETNDSSLVNEIAELEKSQLAATDTAWINVIPLGPTINSGFSEVAPVAIGDTILYYSSMRFPKKGDINQTVSKILSSTISENDYGNALPLADNINSSSYNNANVSVSPDGKIMVFCRCKYDENNTLQCDLYESILKEGKPGNAVKLNSDINASNSTSTQPCITTDVNKGYQLFFASDRKGGEGKLDIYSCFRNANGVYSKPINVGSKINSAENDITPFLDKNGDTLFFASDRSGGLGGYDLYKVVLKNNQPDGFAACLSIPFNSGFNDLYYSNSYGKTQRRYLVSNRPPASKIEGDACCYDIFSINDKAPDTTKRIIPDIASNTKGLNDPTFFFNPGTPVDRVISQLATLLPLSLYFDNDYPDPKSRKTSTLRRYEDLLSGYMSRQKEYQSQQRAENDKVLINNFFTDSVNGNYQRLSLISNSLKMVFDANPGIKVKLKIEGRASSLADSDYNVILSARRISSLLNYWKEWNQGELMKFVNSGQLILIEDPSGEKNAAGKVSDDAKDKLRSIYCLDAALQRKIEITEITLTKP